MGIFDSLSELLEAATPWSTVEAEAPTTRGGASTTKTPADADDEGEGEAKVCILFFNLFSVVEFVDIVLGLTAGAMSAGSEETCGLRKTMTSYAPYTH